MPRTIFYAGLVLFIFGVSSFAGIIPLSGLNNTVTISSLGATCNVSNSCSASVSLMNTNSSIVSGQLWFTVTNQKGQQIMLLQTPLGLSPNVATPMTQTLGTLPAGINYTLSAFFISKYGYAISQTSTAKFSAGNVIVTIDALPASAGTVSPSAGVYPLPLGQSLTLTYTPGPGCTFGSWLDMLGGYTSTANPLTFKPWRNFEFVVQLASQCNIGYPVTPQISPGGTITPSSVQLIAPGSSGVSFTATASSVTTAGGTVPWYFVHWNLMATLAGPGSPLQNVTSLLSSSTTNPITLTYQQLSVNPLSAAYFLQAVFTPQLALVIMPPPIRGGATSTPGAGTYYYTYGQTQTITATVASGYCWQGWIIDGVDQGATTTITVSMTATHAVLPDVTVGGVGSACFQPGFAGVSSSITGFGQTIGLISMVASVPLIFLGLRKRK